MNKSSNMSTSDQVLVVTAIGLTVGAVIMTAYAAVQEWRMTPEERAERDRKRKEAAEEAARKHKEWFESLSEEEKLRYIIRTEMRKEINRLPQSYTCR